MTRKRLKIGRTLVFKAATRSDYKIAKRKIVGIDHFGRPMVRYHGWSDFVVAPHEILEVLD